MISSSTNKQLLSDFSQTKLVANMQPEASSSQTRSTPLPKRFKTSSQTGSFNRIINTTTDIDVSHHDGNRQLAEQFFFQSHPFSDLTVVVQDKELYVDKSILSAVSEVFQSYFQDKNMNSIEIVDVSSHEMVELLQLFYPQFQCTIHFQNVTTLLILAHRFKIEFVSTACRTFILLYLSKFHFIETPGNAQNLIEQGNGVRLSISAILDSLCLWYREFVHNNDASVCQTLLNKLSQSNISTLTSSNIFNGLDKKIQSNIFQARAKYLEKSRSSLASDVI